MRLSTGLLQIALLTLTSVALISGLKLRPFNVGPSDEIFEGPQPPLAPSGPGPSSSDPSPQASPAAPAAEVAPQVSPPAPAPPATPVYKYGCDKIPTCPAAASAPRNTAFDKVANGQPCFNNDTYLPDQCYCNIYYVCTNGVPQRFICPPPLVFDEAVNVNPLKNGACNWPMNVKSTCKTKPIRPFPTCKCDSKCFLLPKCTKKRVLAPLESDTEDLTLTPAPPCPTGEFHPHPCDCGLYYVCEQLGTGDLTPVLKICGPGQTWDQAVEACVSSKDAKCQPPGTFYLQGPLVPVELVPALAGSTVDLTQIMKDIVRKYLYNVD